MSDDENTSIADELRAAFDEYDEPEEIGGSEEDSKVEVRAEEAEESAEESAEEPDTAESGQPRDEQGRFAAKDKDKANTPVDAAPIDEQPETQNPEQDVLKAPQSWKATAREGWATIPKAIQEEVIRRETEINQALHNTAQSRKIGDELMKAAQPYMPMIQAEGSDPVRAAANMFQTAAVLKTGAPMQKAQMLADIVKAYSVDVGLLDQALSLTMDGVPQNPQAQQPQYPQQPYQDPRVDQLLGMLEQQKRSAAEQAQVKTNSEVESFGKTHEFFNDVREEMADLIEVFSKRGVSLSLEDAYNKAITMHPDISQVIAQRKASQNVQSTDRARRASSSIRSNPTVTSQGVPNTLRGALEEAFNSAG